MLPLRPSLRPAPRCLWGSSPPRELALSPSVSWKFSPHWTVQAALETGLFLPGLGDDRQGRVIFTPSLRYGFFE